jgi:hypothetical protein
VYEPHVRHLVIDDWYELIRPHNELPGWNAEGWTCFRLRKDADLAAAREFTNLPEYRCKELTAPLYGKPATQG